MIGVAADAADLEAVEEFFELFKTPWERAVPARRYRVVLSTDGRIEHLQAEQFLVYGARTDQQEREAGISVEETVGPVHLEWNGTTLPIYGRLARFGTQLDGCLRSGGKAVDYSRGVRGRVVRRIGYDLFQEVRHLLTSGQPASNALSPTLELHIAILRQLLQESGVAYVEIPPCPEGSDFICCLTHDVDFFGIRRHTFDRTLAGFLARASIGTLIDFVRGRRPITEAVRNWMAVCSLPLVFLGLRRDFWNPFEDYARQERGRRSTFFLVPFRNQPGVAPDGTIDAARAVRYQASDVSQEARAMEAGGSELAVHGIDAWRDAESGRSELHQMTSLTGGATAGVRMHWLYFDRSSPARLEAAGFDYDSTCGYNDAVGYKAGTSQVFRLPGTRQLMELPLSIMDSALFYSQRMALSREEASRLCREIVLNARRYGGTLVINWHDRSLAPERLWTRFYHALLEQSDEGQRTWFATAGQAVNWFRWRRSIRFTVDAQTGRVTIATPLRRPATEGPGARVYVRRPGHATDTRLEEHRFDGRVAVTLDVERVVA
jgi:hypothetical protein